MRQKKSINKTETQNLKLFVLNLLLYLNHTFKNLKMFKKIFIILFLIVLIVNISHEQNIISMPETKISRQIDSNNPLKSNENNVKGMIYFINLKLTLPFQKLINFYANEVPKKRINFKLKEGELF